MPATLTERPPAPGDKPSNLPAPDSVVLKPDFTEFRTRRPQPQNPTLVVGIAEYWVLDIIGRRLLVHRQPERSHYGSVTSYSSDESAAPVAAPDSNLAIGSLFPE